MAMDRFLKYITISYNVIIVVSKTVLCIKNCKGSRSL